jgi:nucleoside-diphosphate-sugar epimerase
MLVQPLSPERRLQMIAVDDIGAFVALAFEHPDHWRNRAFNLAGDELSMNEAAAQFGRKLGREVQYQQVPWDEFEKRAGREYTMMYRWFEDHGYTCDIAAARSEYRDLHTFERWLHETRI